MGEITNLFTEYSLEELIILIVLVLFVIKFLNDLIGYFYNKIGIYFGVKNKEEKYKEELNDTLLTIKEQIQTLEKQNNQIHKKQQNLGNAIALVQERLQENTRSYLIDAHHKFCYEVHAIDDLNLQAMERRYLYYKTAGGNSFVDNLMDEVRELPKINFYTGKIDENHNGIDDRKE